MLSVNNVLEWVTKLAYANLLWLGLSLLGGVVLGVFPATAATFAVVRKWLTGKSDVPITSTFWRAYKQSLLQANLIGYLMVAIYYLLYLDFLVITLSDQAELWLLTVPFLVIMVFISLTSLYIFPIFVHFNMSVKEVFKNSFFIMMLHPFQTIGMAFGAFAWLYGLWHFQWLFPLFSMSLLAVILLMPALKASNKLIEKQKKESRN